VPLAPSLLFLGIVAAMGYELSEDVLNAARLERESARQREQLTHVNRVSTMGEMAASLAHELNQPLTGILSNAQAGELLLKRHPPDTTELREAFAAVIADTRRASEIIRQMRDFLCKRKTPRAPVDINATIAQVLRLLRCETAIRDLVVRVELAPGIPPVMGHSVQLQQVFLNLLLNAQQAMEATNPAARRLVIRTSGARAGWITVTIDDSGPGFDPATLGKVFDPFFTTRAEGMGMGLAICRSIVEAHFGRIHAANRPEGGARMTIELPEGGSTIGAAMRPSTAGAPTAPGNAMR
jgi:C4-dicarboxylate-specific signal transduction histidine kinase